MTHRPTRPSGFSLIEVMFVTAILAGMIVLFSETFLRTQSLHDDSSMQARAEEDARLSLAVLGKVLLGADFETLQVLRGGTATFNPRTTPGPGTEIRFQRIASWTLAGTVLSAQERIFWRTSGRAVDGVATPGEIVWSHDGIDVVLARNVPAREALVDSNGDGEQGGTENFTDVNGNRRWDPGFAVSLVGGQVRLWVTAFATYDRRITFASFDNTWTLRN
jgi:prepilin-type N-terminal cleavage/methylation domain-containing protein